MIKPVVVTACCLSLVFALPASAGSGTVKWYVSPNFDVSCQISSGGALGTLAYCQSIKAKQSGTLHRNGFVKVCKGSRCLGDPAETAKTLKAGKRAFVGPFECFGQIPNAITCFISKTGKGFATSSSGVRKVTIREAMVL